MKNLAFMALTVFAPQVFAAGGFCDSFTQFECSTYYASHFLYLIVPAVALTGVFGSRWITVISVPIVGFICVAALETFELPAEATDLTKVMIAPDSSPWLFNPPHYVYVFFGYRLLFITILCLIVRFTIQFITRRND